MAAWCQVCEDETGMKDAKLVTTKEGLKAFEGACPQCRCRLFAIPVQQFLGEEDVDDISKLVPRLAWGWDRVDEEATYDWEPILYGSAIGRVVDTGEKIDESVNEARRRILKHFLHDSYISLLENDSLGQWIKVEITYGCARTDAWTCYEGMVMGWFWSHGGREHILDNPQTGDVVIFYEYRGHQIWQKVPQLYLADNAALSKRFKENISLLSSENLEVREKAAENLRYLKDKEAIPHLIRALDLGVEHEKSIYAIAKCLGYLVKYNGDETSVPVLIEALKNQKLGIRIGAAIALGATLDLGESVDEAVVAALVEALGDSDTEVRRSVVWALGWIRDKSIVPQLVEVLKDSDASVRESSAQALGMIGDKSAVPALEALLKDKEPKVSKAAEKALKRIESV